MIKVENGYIINGLKKELDFLEKLSVKGCGGKSEVKKTECEHSKALQTILADKEFCFFDPLLSADEKNAIFKELEKKEEQILKNCKCGV